MTPDRWHRIEELYHAALERPEGERSAYLRDSCADDADLCKEVEELLDQKSAGIFLESPAVQAAAEDLVSSPMESLAGQTFGRYKIVSVLGRGGMGVVYVMLWGASVEQGFTSPNWMTFRQALALNAHVRKGERGSLVVYANTFTRAEEDADGQEVDRSCGVCAGPASVSRQNRQPIRELWTGAFHPIGA